MTGTPLFGRLLSAEGELIAEGPCWLDERARQATMEPARTPGVLHRERGRLALQLESGRSYGVSDKPLIFQLRPNGHGTNGHGPEPQRTLYRLHLIDHGAQDAGAAGAAEEGHSAPDWTGLRLNGETPAAR